MRKTMTGILGVALAIGLMLVPDATQAQRPSLGGLQQQINGMLSGDVFFDVLAFGDECRIFPDPEGLVLSDPGCFQFRNPLGFPKVLLEGGRIDFGPDCTIGINPKFTGLVESDPGGFRLLGQDNQGCILRFGPTDDCTIGIDPTLDGGMVFRDVGCFIFQNPLPLGVPEVQMFGGTLRFGEECSIGVDPNLTGLVESDPGGFRLLGRDQQGCILRFGPTDDCTIGIDPTREGMIFRDVGCFVFENPIGGPPEIDLTGGILSFGDECRFRVDPNLTGLVEEDPGGLRLLGQNGEGCILTFGPTDECRIFVDPNRRDFGLINQDIRTILFESPAGSGLADVQIDGLLTADEFAQSSRRDLKENIRPIENPIEKVMALRGVTFDWKKDVKQAKDGSSRTDIGFIADEVANVVSEATVFNDDKEPQAVKYANLVALVVESVKAQQEQIEAQQELIEELRDEVARLTAAQQK